MGSHSCLICNFVYVACSKTVTKLLLAIILTLESAMSFYKKKFFLPSIFEIVETLNVLLFICN